MFGGYRRFVYEYGSVNNSKTIIDLSASYEFSNSLTFTVGGNNILNVYPTEQYDGWTDQGGFSDSVQMGSDGSYFFGRLTFRL